MESVATIALITPSLADSASSEYNAVSKLHLGEMLVWIANIYTERESDNELEKMSVFSSTGGVMGI
ncbi:MAG: hypothetical protein M1818_007209 [Claussenomyces sp. TS43310]|nr:MAG: hypothetical protein M1818_007209 [Claussenomyces sp. TS43310]